ncbi:MAG: hypothetical protein IBX62_06680 [Coriobacteriia bacterium]|nr:hypothetical protein [Coriobacteriia bacterium]
MRPEEMLTLGVTVMLLPVVILTLRGLSIPGSRFLQWSYAAMLVSHLATNVEAYVLPDAFNLLEHAAVGAAGVLFALGIVAFARREWEGEPE